MKNKILCILLVFSMLCAICLSSCTAKKTALQSIEISGNKIECNMDMQDVLKMFPDLKYEYFESISCEYNGLDKIYDFADAGFIVYTYPLEDKDYVLEVTVSSEDIKQNDNTIYNGMSKQQLIDLFGEDYTVEGDTITYNVDEKQTMYYLLEGDKVIEYAISVAE